MPNSSRVDQLQSRVYYLEEINKWYMFAVDILRQMGDIHGDASKLRTSDSILHTAKHYINMFFGFERMAFYLINEDDADFYCIHADPKALSKEIDLDVEELIASGKFSWALNQNKAVIYDVSSKHHVLLHVIASKTRIRGMFVGYFKASEAQRLTDGPLSLLSVVLHNTGYALESSALYDIVHRKNDELERKVEARTRELEYQYRHDVLTGLPNRSLFFERIQQGIERAVSNKSDGELVVLLIDLDMFKVVNDTLGHDVGDELLIKVSKRLESVLRRYDVSLHHQNMLPSTLARIGGDEFGILVPDITDSNEISTLIQQLLSSNTEPLEINKEKIIVTSSIGVSFYPADGDDPQTLLKRADAAMYHAKDEGRSNFQYYTDKISYISTKYLQITAKLHQAVKTKDFELFYQPQVDLKSQKIVGFEALIRWPDGEGGYIPPDDFIPIAEDTGMIVEIGNWVVHEACQLASQIKQAGEDIRVAVNLSAKQFRDDKLVENIMSEIMHAGIMAKDLEIEITEGIIIQDVEKTIKILNTVHDAGLSVAVDDFGTGYSSLSYLKQFNIDCLKVDRSFVKDVVTDADDEAIVRAVVALAHNMNLFVVAEGVETIDQLNFLKDIDCEVVQGYYYSKPIPSNNVLPYISDFRKDTK